MAGLKPITTEPWADDAVRFLDESVERTGDFTDAGEVELRKRLEHMKQYGTPPATIQSDLFEESLEYQEAVLTLRKERMAAHGSFIV